MKRALLLVLLVSVVFTLGTGATSASAAPTRAAKVAVLYKNPPCDCKNGATPSGRPYGLAVLRLTREGKLSVAVALIGAEANSVYDLHIHQYPPGCPPSDVFPNAIRTNARGVGAAVVTVARLDGATKFWVCAMHGMDMTQDHFVSPGVEF